jgi:hypothetical protein
MPRLLRNLIAEPSGRKSFAIVSIVVVIVIVAAYNFSQWKSLSGFVTSLDHGNVLFEDYVDHFYPMGRQILSSDRPVQGYFYSAFFALLLSPLSQLPETAAVWFWGILQVVSLALLWSLPRRSLMKLPPNIGWLYALVFLTSVPVLHNFKWGQVSVPITLIILGSIVAHQRGGRILSGALLGLAAAIKYYPGLFALYYLYRRDARALTAFAFAAVLFLLVFPAAVFTPAGVIDFQKESFAAISDAPWVAKNVNSQYLPHVALRVLPFRPTEGTRAALTMAGFGVVCATLGLLWLHQRRTGRCDPPLFAAGAFLSLPFLLRTSWPHYFAFLPYCQMLILWRLWGMRQGWRAWSLVFCAVTLVSAALSSVFVFNLFPHWYMYSSRGLYLAADLLSLAALYGLIGLCLREARREGAG